MLKLVLFLFWILMSSVSFSQNSETKTRLEYFNHDFTATSKDSAKGFYLFEYNSSDTLRVVRKSFEMDSVLISVSEFSNYSKKIRDGYTRYYFSNGALQTEEFYIDGKLEGKRQRFFENGRTRLTAYYSNGELEGTLKVYNDSGNLIREEKFINNISKEAKCYADNGKSIHCEPFYRAAQFPGGEAAFIKYISSEFNYPRSMMEKGESGYILVRFVVEKDGTIGRFKTMECSNMLMEKEAFRVLSKSLKWIPAIDDGEPVRAWRQIPIRLSLN